MFAHTVHNLNNREFSLRYTRNGRDIFKHFTIEPTFRVKKENIIFLSFGV